MQLFKRKKQETDETAPEIQEYYQAERRERTGVAWLLALATLGVTVLLALGIYFGGRWAYRNVYKKNQTASTAKTEQQITSDQGNPTVNTVEPPKDTTKDKTTPTVSQPASNPAASASPTTTTPAAGPSGAETLVRTGPDDNL